MDVEELAFTKPKRVVKSEDPAPVQVYWTFLAKWNLASLDKLVVSMAVIHGFCVLEVIVPTRESLDALNDTASTNVSLVEAEKLNPSSQLVLSNPCTPELVVPTLYDSPPRTVPRPIYPAPRSNSPAFSVKTIAYPRK